MDVVEKIASALGISKRLLIEYNEEPMVEEQKAIRPLQQRLKMIPKLPPEGQKYLIETIDMLAGQQGISMPAE